MAPARTWSVCEIWPCSHLPDWPQLRHELYTKSACVITSPTSICLGEDMFYTRNLSVSSPALLSVKTYPIFVVACGLFSTVLGQNMAYLQHLLVSSIWACQYTSFACVPTFLIGMSKCMVVYTRISCACFLPSPFEYIVKGSSPTLDLLYIRHLLVSLPSTLVSARAWRLFGISLCPLIPWTRSRHGL